MAEKMTIEVYAKQHARIKEFADIKARKQDRLKVAFPEIMSDMITVYEQWLEQQK